VSGGGAPVLLTSRQRTSTTLLLAEAAERRGMLVAELTGSRVLDGLTGGAVHWYGGPLAVDRVAGHLEIGLLEPADGWLAALADTWIGRIVELATLSDARSSRRPVFVKPPSDKSFPAAVYADGSRLPGYRGGLGPDTPVLVSDVVTFAVEYRLFVLDGAVVAGSRYAVYGRLDVAPLTADAHDRDVREVATKLLDAVAGTLPSAVTLDVGLIQDPDTGVKRWAVVEANMPWFSHSYAADPDAVLQVVLRAAGPRQLVAPRDIRFLRPHIGA